VHFRVAEARRREYSSRAFSERSFVHFEHSQILWLAALIVPLLGLFLGWAWLRRRERVTHFIHANLVEQLTLSLSTARRKTKLALLLGVVLLLFLALARPKGGYEWQETETRSLDILVAVDTSRSMLATDQSPNRLERAKLAVLDLMRLARGDRLGLIAFSGTAFLQCPLTIDRNAFIQNVNSLSTDIIPQGGTAISKAVTEALRTFEKEEDNHKVLVLMTDGEDHEAGVTDAAEKAKNIGMKIFTIGLGSTEGELIQLPDPQTGQLEFLKNESGSVIKSRLNETLLRTLSTDTGAFYLPLQGADTMERLYEAGLAGLTPNSVDNQMTKRYIERYQWPLGLAILLLLGEMLLREGRRQPHKNSASLAALGLLMFAPTALAAPADARRAMEQEDFEGALSLYEELLKESPEDARLNYNAGAAAYRNGDFEKARDYFNLTLASPEAPPPLQQPAFYNLGNAMFRLGETTENPDEKKKQWSDALEKYEGAYELSQKLEESPDDEDAQFNTNIVKKHLEQLEQQQQQQQQGDDKQDKENQDKNEQQKDQQQQKSDDQKKQEQEEQQQKDQQQKQDQQKSDDEKKEQQQQQSGQEQEEKKEEQQKQDGSSGEDKKEQSQPNPGEEQSNTDQAQPDGKMTREQVHQLLNTLKQQERSLIYRPVQKGKVDKRVIIKNW